MANVAIIIELVNNACEEKLAAMNMNQCSYELRTLDG